MAGLQMIGDDDAATCVDGVCAVPLTSPAAGATDTAGEPGTPVGPAATDGSDPAALNVQGSPQRLAH